MVVAGAVAVARRHMSATMEPASKSVNQNASTNSVDPMDAGEVAECARTGACVPMRSNVRSAAAALNVPRRNVDRTAVAALAVNVRQDMYATTEPAKRNSEAANRRINPDATVASANLAFVGFRRRVVPGCGLRIVPTSVQHYAATVSDYSD